VKTDCSSPRKLTALLLLAGTAGCAAAPTINVDDPQSPFHLIRKIELPDVSGRIDHLALDTDGRRLFVAEYGNGSVDELDLASGKMIGRIAGLRGPQGVAWLPEKEEIAVASGDGSLRFYRAADRQQVAAINLGDDADNERVDPRTGNLLVGFGSGGLAIIDPSDHRIVRDLKLPAHPEAFAIIGSRVFVNVPDMHSIVLGDLEGARIIRSLGTGELSGNFPMAVDAKQSQIAVAFRFPAAVSVMDADTTSPLFSIGTCKDADDLYFYRNRIVVVCGEGVIELIGRGSSHSAVRVRTRSGARTGLLDTELGHLFVALPAKGGAAEIWELSFK
jgi:hypothetical protein